MMKFINRVNSKVTEQHQRRGDGGGHVVSATPVVDGKISLTSTNVSVVEICDLNSSIKSLPLSLTPELHHPPSLNFDFNNNEKSDEYRKDITGLPSTSTNLSNIQNCSNVVVSGCDDNQSEIVVKLRYKMPLLSGQENGHSVPSSAGASAALPPPPTTLKPGTLVIANFRFTGKSPEDLPFEKDDILTIELASKDPNWYNARRKDGKKGMIPINYVKKKFDESISWFHGKISRTDAEKLLKERHDGSFLVRESTNFPGDYTLCVVFQGKVEHYRIQYNKSTSSFTCDDEEFFSSLEQLVAHYLQDADGLVTRLTEPVPKSENSFVDRLRKKNYLIRGNELTLKQCLGKGEFSEVVEGEYLGERVAVKVLKTESQVSSLLQEAELMCSLNHPNLVPLRGVVVDDPTKPLLVMEYEPNGNLREYLQTRGRIDITAGQLLNFAFDVASGMSNLELKGLIHRDLAARNVLLDQNMNAKVCDFGLAKNVDENESSTFDNQSRIAIKWTAPEAISLNKFSSKSDVWSFGILLWEIYSFGRIPYPRIQVTEVAKYVGRGYRMDQPQGCPSNIWSLMGQCWDLDVDKRPSFHQIVSKLKQFKAELPAPVQQLQQTATNGVYEN